jgi:hypothetical protein
LKNILLISILTLSILVGGNVIDKSQDNTSQVAYVDDAPFTTNSVTGDPGGGEI